MTASREASSSGVTLSCRSSEAAPASASARAFSPWSWPIETGSGMKIAGRPATAISATVLAPARAITRCAAAEPLGDIGEERRDLRQRCRSPHGPRCTRSMILGAHLLRQRDPRRASRPAAAASAGGTRSLSARAPSEPPSTSSSIRSAGGT